jgi:cell division protein FtsN
MKDAVARKEAKRPAYLNAKNSSPQKKASEKGPDTEKRAKTYSASSQINFDEKTSAYALQVGAFKVEQSALTVKENLQKKIANKQIRICQQGEFYKVRIMGFDNIEEVNSMLNTGIDGLVIRTGKKACGI